MYLLAVFLFFAGPGEDPRGFTFSREFGETECISVGEQICAELESNPNGVRVGWMCEEFR